MNEHLFFVHEKYGPTSFRYAGHVLKIEKTSQKRLLVTHGNMFQSAMRAYI